MGNEEQCCMKCGESAEDLHNDLCGDCVGECSRCNEFYDSDDIKRDSSNKLFCEDCYKEVYSECDKCGEETLKHDTCGTADGDTLCEGCYTEIYTECEGCEADLLRTDAIPEPGGDCYFCERCYNELYTQCPRCNEFIYRDAMIEGENESHCEVCGDSPSSRCAYCNQWVSEEGAHTQPDGRLLCRRCHKRVFGGQTLEEEFFSRINMEPQKFLPKIVTPAPQTARETSSCTDS